MYVYIYMSCQTVHLCTYAVGQTHLTWGGTMGANCMRHDEPWSPNPWRKINLIR